MSGFYEKDIHYHNVIASEYEAVVVQPRSLANDLAFGKFSDLIPAKGTMLDLGCGTGHMLLRYAGQFEQAFGIDHSHGMLAAARQSLEAAKLGHVELVESALNAWLSQDDSTFDLITAVGVLHHQPHGKLGELLSLVRGRMHLTSLLLIAEPLDGLPGSPPQWLARWNQRSYAATLNYSEHPEDPDEAPVDLATLEQALAEGGLKTIRFIRGTEVFPRGPSPSLLDHVIARLASRFCGHRGHIGFLAAGPA